MKVSTKIKWLLFEAYRRNELRDEVEDNKPLNKRWTGLGTEAAYRAALEAGLMVFHDSRIPPPRCMGWLCLTKAGITAMKEHEAEFKERLESMQKYGLDLKDRYMLAGGLTAK